MNRALLFLLLLFTLPASAQSTHLQTFPLHHRPVEEVVPMVRQLVPAASVTGTGYKLIVRGTLEQLVEVERLLKQIDTATAQLMVTVRQGGRADDSGAGAGAGRGGVQVYETDRRQVDRTAQQLRVNEGGWARIDVGTSTPLTTQTLLPGPNGTVVRQSQQYRDTGSGFEVRPRLSGQLVTLDIRPYRSRPASIGSGAVEVQEVQTTVSGRLGEWILLAGVDERTSRSGNTIVHSTGSRAEETLNVYVRVERVD